VSNYRVALDEPSSDPLSVDLALAAKQHAARLLFVHSLLTLCTVGLWLPLLVAVLLLRAKWADAAVQGYRVQLSSKDLFVGTAAKHWMVPLDQIQSLSTANGVVTVALEYKQSGHTIDGLIDPLAASRAILAARDAARSPSRGDKRVEHHESVEDDAPRTHSKAGAR
jgi:hypothetical protein